MMTPTRIVAAIATLFALLPTASTAAPEDGQQFRDWVAACPKAPDSDEIRCFIFQNLSTTEGNQPVLSVRVGYVRGSEQPAALLTVPLGVFLPAGMAMGVDEAEPVRVAFQVCNPGGCLAAIPLEAAQITAMKNGKQAKVTFQDGRRQPVTVPVSLSGFTAGFDSLK